MPPVDLFDVINKLTSWQRINQVAQSQVQGDPGLSQRLGDYQNRYWWMDPGAIWSMAKAGIEATHPVAMQAAQVAAGVKTDSGLGWNGVGQPMHANTPVDLSKVQQQLNQVNQPAAPVDPSQYAAQPPPIAGLFGKNQHTGLISFLNNLPTSHWDALDPGVKQELSQLQFTPTDPSQIPNYNPNDTQRAPVQQAFEVQGGDNLSPAASNALTQAVNNSGGTQMGPWNFKPGAYQQDPTMAARYGSKNLLLLGGQHADMGGVGTGGIQAAGLPAIPNIGPEASKGIQVGMMAAQAPLQELQGQVRNVYQLAVNQQMPKWLQSQSDLGILLGEGSNIKPGDIGDGLLGAAPGSPVVQERQARERERGNIAGHSVTLGRAVASVADAATLHKVIEPGSTQYQLLSGLVDAAVAVKGDPTAHLLGGFGTEPGLFEDTGSVGKAIQAFRENGSVNDAFKAFSDAGGITGLRGTVNQDAVNKWLDGPQGDHVVNQIANTTGDSAAYTIWRKTNRQADPALTAALADMSDPASVKGELQNALGAQIRTKPDVGAFTQGLPGQNLDDALVVRNTQNATKWTAQMPGDSVSSIDPVANAHAVERAGALVKMPEMVPQWFDQMARATSGSERQGVWDNIMADVEDKLVGQGIARDRARRLTRLNQADEAVSRAYSAQAATDGLDGSGNVLVNNGQPLIQTTTQPGFLGQTLNDDIQLPDWRALRTALTDPKLRPIIDNPAVQGVEGALEKGQQVWKGLQIATPKTMMKVVADEQLGVAARGYDSLANHPIHALGMILATPQAELPEDAGFLARMRQASAKFLRWNGEQVGKVLPSAQPSLTGTLTGHSFDDIDNIKLIAQHGIDTTATDPGVILAKYWHSIYQGQPGVAAEDFLDAHAKNLAQYAASPDTQAFARAGSLQEAQDAYWNGDLQGLRESFARRTGNDMLAADRATSDEYVRQQLVHMNIVSGGNPDVMNSIANGKLGDTPIWTELADGTHKVNPGFIQKLNDYRDSFPVATIQQSALYDKSRTAMLNGAFKNAVHILLGTPSAMLSKSPLYRQAYWETAADNAPFMDEAGQTVLRANADAANLSPGLKADLAKGLAQGTGQISAEQADTLAHARALDIVRRTTHEFSNRSQLFDQLRLLTPFGEVWRKTMLRWANIIRENPQTVRRLQQGILQAQSPEMGDVLAQGPGHPAGEGFFHKDQYGAEVFSVPFSGFMTQHIPFPDGTTNHIGPIPTGPIPVPSFSPVGVPVPLAGNVMGLSVGTEMFPALGPVMQIPAAYLMQQVHASPTIMNAVFPYGPPTHAADPFNYAPSWLKTALGQDRTTNLDSPRVFANSVKSILSYGITSGEYDTSTPAGISAAVEDATKRAHQLYAIQGASQFFTPGAPQQQFLARDPGGKLVDLSLLAKDYASLNQANPNTATDQFVQKYGTKLLQAATSKSYAYVFGIPTDPNSAKWVDDHANLRRDFPLIYGYFAPPSDPNNFDYSTYQQQFNRGERVALSPEQWLKIGNGRLAAMQYGKARDQIDQLNKGKAPTSSQRQWLAKVKQNLMDEYPGYSEALYGGQGVPQRPNALELVGQAKKAANDPTVQGTDAGKGLVAYLQARDQADQAWTSADKSHSAGGWTQASSSHSVALRDWLRKVGANLVAEHPQFGPLFDSVFAREMKDDTQPAGVIQGG